MSVPEDPDLVTTDGRVPGHRGRATRRRLLEATTELVATTPWRSISVVDIARRAGTSPATFYQYFENLEAAVTVLAEELAEGAATLAELVDADWSGPGAWGTAVSVVEGFSAYWASHRAVLRVVEQTPVGDGLGFQGQRARAIGALTSALAGVIADQGRASRSPTGADPLATATALIAMMTQVAGHPPHVVETGIRSASLVDSQARLLLWSVTGRRAPERGERTRGPAPGGRHGR
jgi:AcrR family transcriptional regulator